MIPYPDQLPLIKASRKRRIAAYMIDHVVLTFSIVLIVFALSGESFMNEDDPGRSIAGMMAVLIPFFLLYFAKDSIKGISIGKWVMGIMVRDENEPDRVPSLGRLFLRNLFMIIWPVEFIILATSDQKKRLGDNVARTIVCKNPDKPSKVPRVLSLVGIAVLLSVSLFFLVGTVIKSSGAYKAAIDVIQKDPAVIHDTGGIKGYGMMPSGNISVTNGQGQANLSIKVLGETKDLDVHVYLEKQRNENWEVLEMEH